MNPNDPKPPKESGRRNFNLKVWFYDHFVDEDSGEVFQKEFVYVGKDRRKKLFSKGIKIENELDALLYELHKKQLKIELAICWDNNKPKGSPEREVFRIERGIVKKEIRMNTSLGQKAIKIFRLDQYQVDIKKIIPNYKLIPHDIQKTA